ncbi:hypothetical protein D0962_20865 [Leptolyngbyaceae cyanobacterium CCMR0082]|uniref:Uncharacterized protein n=3 Tax=Adonisia TaxID=2950183 RepID=A0A6M0S9M9_9CYAN|nr:hypothetical protein [Adonisia turfae CCMR0081]NEZ65197.1 hypothetical protein [Adonisia turfae CCMR0082]
MYPVAGPYLQKNPAMKRIILSSSLILSTVLGITGAANAQVPAVDVQASTETACSSTTQAEQIALNAAKNEARQMAEFTNGGLNYYRAERAMHGAAIESPCEVIAPETWRFTIRGGDPTDVVLSEEYTTVSIVTVQGTGSDRTITLDYNGPIEEYGQQ